MSKWNALFRKRIGISENEDISFDALDDILAKTARTIPFENLCIIDHRMKDITKENIMDKILVKNEGGLCYELNSLFYYFLIENGFHAVLVRGVIYDNEAKEYLKIGRTHVTILLTHEGQTYVIDTGFGANLPLKPVPLTGESVSSDNGEFRVKQQKSEHGDYVLEMKLRDKDPDWTVGYAFDSKRPVNNVSAEMNEVQKIIAEHEESRFNKRPLITRLTGDGKIILTDTSFTERTGKSVAKEEIDKKRFKEILKEQFGI